MVTRRPRAGEGVEHGNPVEGAEIVGQSGAAAAAIVVIATRPGTSIERLREPLGLTQPGATRLVERLVDNEWVQRSGPGGRRGLQLTLTDTGRDVFDELLAARRATLTQFLAPLSAAQRTQLSAFLETLLAAHVHDRPDLERLCRLCERSVCDRCPVGGRLDRILAERATSPASASAVWSRDP